MHRIDEPFFSTKEMATGVGLGLSVACGIVQRHGATLEVESVVNRGTTFRLTLPRRPPFASPAATDDHDRPP
jgi:signal transduction histidine kinase